MKGGSQPKRGESFRNSTVKMMQYCSEKKGKVFNIPKLCHKMGFERRRFYDVVNVLDVCGCCEKVDAESIVWHGLENIKPTLTMMAQKYGTFEPTKTLCDIVPGNISISISVVTKYFILCFLSTNQKILDIKEISAFLSRENGRMKTTLCKLYQIVQIFDSLEVLYKTSNVGQFTINPKYFPSIDKQLPATESPCSLSFLLNKPVPFFSNDVILKRQQDFKNIVSNIT